MHFTKERARCGVRQTSDVVYLIHLLSDIQPVSKESIYNETTPVVDIYLKISQTKIYLG